MVVDESASGSSIECPSCGESVTVPEADPSNLGPPHSPIKESAAAKEEKHFKVPFHDAPSEVLIEKPQPPLEAAAKETDKKLRVKTIRRTDCQEVGKDKFDETVTSFLQRIGEENIISITPVNYSHPDMAGGHQIYGDYGVMVVYRG